MSLRVLCLSNLYPPLGIGGYEQWCQEVSQGLRARGHNVLVLTSRYQRRSAKLDDPTWVHRELFLEMDFQPLLNGIKFFTRRSAHEKRNQDCLRHTIADFRPDVVLVWGMWNLSRALPAAAETLLPGRVVYYIGDYWPTLASQHELYWQEESNQRIMRSIKRMLKRYAEPMLAELDRPSVAFDHVLVPSNFMGEELTRLGVPIKKKQLVYGAADLEPFLTGSQSNGRDRGTVVPVIYAGQLTPNKGVHTAIEAFAFLVNVLGVLNVELIIVGAGDPVYEAGLHRLVEENGLGQFVRFAGKQPKQLMPAFYRQAKVFVFTSIWPEPFGRVLVEAMAAGLAVVGTATGGAAEILEESRTALLFQPGDAHELAYQLKRLVDDRALLARLARQGQQQALERFHIARMVDEIEGYLLECATS